MNWFRSLSVFQKILMVPLIGTLGFVIYLTLNIQTAGNNAGLLESVRDRQFPLLQIAERSLLRLDQIKDTLATAVSTGEEEALQQAGRQPGRNHPGRHEQGGDADPGSQQGNQGNCFRF